MKRQDQTIIADISSLNTIDDAKHRMWREIIQTLDKVLTAPGDDLLWTGRRSDLMEIIHEIALLQVFKYADGTTVPFIRLVNQLCRRLHTRCPANPWIVAIKARRRKGQRSASFMKRYPLIRQRYSSPVGMYISRCSVDQ